MSTCFWVNIVSSTRFDFESGDTIYGIRILFPKTCKLSLTFLSSHALLNTNVSFTAIFFAIRAILRFLRLFFVVFFFYVFNPVKPGYRIFLNKSHPWLEAVFE